MKSSIHAQRGGRLAADRQPRSDVECASRSARSAAATLPSSSRRSSGCSRSQAITSCSASRYSRSFSSATGRRPGAWRAAAGARRPSRGARSRCGAGASGCAPPLPTAWKRREKRAPAPNSSAGRGSRSWAISSSGWFITGVPVSASRSAPAQPLGEPAHRLVPLGARVLDVVRLVEHERPRARSAAGAVGVDDVVVEIVTSQRRRSAARARRPPSPTAAAASARVSRSQLSFRLAGQITTAGYASSPSSAASAWTVLPRPCSSARNVRRAFSA